MNEILKRYDSEVRANPIATPGLQVVRDAHVIKLEGAFNFVCSWDFSEDQAEDEVRQQAAYFRQKGESLMWRVFDHDQPSNLEAYLKQEGFAPSPQGTLMVFPLEGWSPTSFDHDIRRVDSTDALKDYLSVAAEAFEDDDDDQFDYFSNLLSDPNFALYTGYVDNQPVVSGRLEIPIGTSFGLLFGGGVSPAHRGKGFYRALVHTRASLAIELGLNHLSTEAMETSRPILEKIGFLPVSKETTWILPAK